MMQHGGRHAHHATGGHERAGALCRRPRPAAAAAAAQHHSGDSTPQQQQPCGQQQLARRQLLAASVAAASTLLCAQQPARASVPELAAPGQWGLPFSMVTPEPARFPRKALNLRFAVLLMRSSFDAVNALDFIPMDSFEAKFWKLRQSELESYNYLYDPLKMRQGDLTDPLYLDFISFSQYSTISREMERPQKVFSEYVEVCPPGAGEDDPCEGGKQVVTRPPQYEDDAQLPAYFFDVAGSLMMQGLWKGFQGAQFGGPAPAPAAASIQQLAAGVDQLLQAMVRAGYAISAAVTDIQPSSGGGSGGSFTVTVTGPCNLWALAALRARNSKVVNAYDVMATAAWLKASGRRAQHEVELGESGLTERWRVV